GRKGSIVDLSQNVPNETTIIMVRVYQSATNATRLATWPEIAEVLAVLTLVTTREPLGLIRRVPVVMNVILKGILKRNAQIRRTKTMVIKVGMAMLQQKCALTSRAHMSCNTTSTTLDSIAIKKMPPRRGTRTRTTLVTSTATATTPMTDAAIRALITRGVVDALAE
nr:hypothetical protein [Tanacetum cinerariifolium]